MAIVNKGTILIAEPFLKDSNFTRSVVLICESNEQGAFGLVLNQACHVSLHDLISESEIVDFPVYLGGPVSMESLHFVHTYPDLISGGEEMGDGIYWGGNFEEVKIHLQNGNLQNDGIKFFLGYSGWGAGQLAHELSANTWLTGTVTRRLIFETYSENIWAEALKELGGEYQQMIHYPVDPSYN